MGRLMQAESNSAYVGHPESDAGPVRGDPLSVRRRGVSLGPVLRIISDQGQAHGE